MTINNPKSTISALICVFVLVGTLLGGFVPRQLGAGVNAKLLNHAAAKLGRPLPDRVGGWRLLREGELETDVIKMLQCEAYINRVYVHDETGDRVSVAMILGPGGPIAVHTPEICYSSQDYTLDGERTMTTLLDGKGTEQTFWNVSFQPNNVGAQPIRVLYGWSNGTSWEATKDPRFAHGWRPYLYKIQIAGPIAGNLADFEPCQDFLTRFVDQLRPQLLLPDPA